MQLEIIIFRELNQIPKANAVCFLSFVLPRFYIVKYNHAQSYAMKLEENSVGTRREQRN